MVIFPSLKNVHIALHFFSFSVDYLPFSNTHFFQVLDAISYSVRFVLLFSGDFEVLLFPVTQLS